MARYERKDGGAFWLGFWDDEDGVRRQRKFSVRTHGEAEAMRRAVEVRLQAESVFRQRLVELKHEA